jgi:carnitine-CoA ligase
MSGKATSSSCGKRFSTSPGIEVVALGLMERIGIALVERFSASRFWSDVRRYRCDAHSFRGGVLALLLNQPPRADDADSPVRIAWGGGCPAAISETFEWRFGLQIPRMLWDDRGVELHDDRHGGESRFDRQGAAYYDARIVDQDGRALGPGERGEIWIREKVPGG